MSDAAMTHGAPVGRSLSTASIETRVTAIVRELAQEAGGARAAAALTASASLERDVGLGSLERAELLLRLERDFQTELDDQFLRLDSVQELARALAEVAPSAAERGAAAVAAAPPPATLEIDADTIHGALWTRARADPGRVHVFLREEDGRDRPITFGELRDGAAAIAGGLRERGLRAGETVALMLPTSFDFLRAFQGILAAGGIPVPLYPPVRLDRLEEYLRRQRGILVNAGARCLIAMPEAAPVSHVLRREVPSLREVTTTEELAARGEGVADAGGAPDDPALIQYTSGSTGDPKGVLLTHANLLANIRATATGIDLRPTDVAASWLPLYHDMGLIGTWLFCVYWGVPLSLQSPLSFLARPERWLWTIHRRRVTLSAAPNFAYELCVRKISAEALEGLELSSWRCALNGAEPVSPDTLARFADRFAPYGFHRDALLPVYGLAECAVALSFPPLGRTPRVDRVARAPFERDGRAEPAGEGEQALRFVSVGMPLAGHDVRVVGDTGSELPERTVGRIVFRGPSVMAGYYHNPAATAAISLPGGWMDSGDLGYRSDGELFVTGRRKDLLIIRGRNLVPQELEEIAGAVEGVRTGCVAAIGVADAAEGTERLVIIAETRSADSAQWSRMESEIVARVAEATGTPPERVVLVAPGTVPKTPSGKIQRSATKARYLAGTLGGQPRLSLRRRVALVEGAALTTAARIARAAARRLARALYAIYLALAFGVGGLVVALPCWALAAAVPSRRLAAALERIAARLALRLAGFRLTVEGVERLPVRGPCVLASNHASHADVPSLLALLPGDVVIVAKQEVLDWPIVGTFVRRVEHPTVDRSAPERGLAAFAEIARRVRAGAAVLFFPEATFTAAAGLRPFRLGAFEVAVATGAPVVPLALRGTRQVLRSGTALPRPGPIHLWIGAPIAPDGEGWEAAVHLRDRVAEAIAAHCGEPRLDLVAAGPVAAPATPSAPRQADRRA